MIADFNAEGLMAVLFGASMVLAAVSAALCLAARGQNSESEIRERIRYHLELTRNPGVEK